MIRSRKLLGVAATAALLPAALAVAGCGGSSSSSSTTTAATTATTGTTTTGTTTMSHPAQMVAVTADPSGKLDFLQKTLTAKAGAIDFKLTNASAVGHNLAIDGGGTTYGPTATVDNGKTADLTVTLKPGTYQFYCQVAGHKEAGMQGTLTVK